MTNGDKIRSMTDEELAEFISRIQIGDFSNLDYGKLFVICAMNSMNVMIV